MDKGISKRIDIKSLTLPELTAEMTSMGEKAFRARQLYEWMHVKLARDFEGMTNLSKALREECRQRFTYTALQTVRVLESKIDGTKKFLFELSDGNLVESVWMRYKHGNSVCISSQVGCRMGCAFCASGIEGLERNLTPGEMLDQVYAITLATGERVSNVVVMGTGEPLDNYNNLLTFIRMLTDEDGLHISQRNVTVSTCGLVPQMKLLAADHTGIVPPCHHGREAADIDARGEAVFHRRAHGGLRLLFSGDRQADYPGVQPGQGRERFGAGRGAALPPCEAPALPYQPDSDESCEGAGVLPAGCRQDQGVSKYT